MVSGSTFDIVGILGELKVKNIKDLWLNRKA